MTRAILHRYVDPLDEIWLRTAARLGLRVRRVADAYASTDGQGGLDIAEAAALDADDSLAQMIFHEICHWLVEGPDARAAADWGLDNTRPDDEWREHACLRAQWILSGRYGVRELLAPTTDFRAFWDSLVGDALADRGDLSVQAAIAAIARARKPPWAPALEQALEATGQVARAVTGVPGASEGGTLPPLWGAVTQAPAPHPSGLPMGQSPTGTCGTCAWRFASGRAPRCRQLQADGAAPARQVVDDAWPACERYEAALDCQRCGACCGSAYHSVEVSRRDPFVRRHPELVVDRGSFLEVRREGDRCAALHGGEVSIGDGVRRSSPVTCVVYDDRPRTCRDFTLGSAHCLTARRRVSLSL